MRASILIATVTLAVACSAGAQEEKSAWKKAGRAFRDTGAELFDAIGKSIGGDDDLEGEWREVGQSAKGAGKGTAEALEESVDADE